MLLCVRIMWACILNTLNTCQRGTKSSLHLLSISKTSIRAAQQRHNSNSSGTTQVNLATLVYIGTPVYVPPFQLATPPGFQVIHNPKGNLVLLCTCKIGCFRNTFISSSGRGYFLALSAAGIAGNPLVHHGASEGLGQAPWRVLWAFKVAKSGK